MGWRPVHQRAEEPEGWEGRQRKVSHLVTDGISFARNIVVLEF